MRGEIKALEEALEIKRLREQLHPTGKIEIAPIFSVLEQIEKALLLIAEALIIQVERECQHDPTLIKWTSGPLRIKLENLTKDEKCK